MITHKCIESVFQYFATLPNNSDNIKEDNAEELI